MFYDVFDKLFRSDFFTSVKIPGFRVLTTNAMMCTSLAKYYITDTVAVDKRTR
jgi:hypothetical protein